MSVIKRDGRVESFNADKIVNAARKAYNEKLVAARKSYNEAVRKAKDEFEASLKESTESLEKAEANYGTKRKAFQKAHPEGYHITLKDGDNVVTYTSDPADGQIRIFDDFDDMLDLFSNFLRRL